MSHARWPRWLTATTLLLTVPGLVWPGVASVSGGRLPDYSDDGRVQDVLLGKADVTVGDDDVTVDDDDVPIIAWLRQENQDKPDRCRIGVDLCHRDRETLDDKGHITWPSTALAYRRYVRCPYSVYNATYASRDCLLVKGNATWGPSNTLACPDPPLSQVLDMMEVMGDGAPIHDWTLATVDAVHKCLVSYTDQPFLVDAIHGVLNLAFQVATMETGSGGAPLTWEFFRKLLHALDVILNAERLDSKVLSNASLESVQRLMTTLAGLCDLIPAPPSDQVFLVVGDVLSVCTGVGEETGFINFKRSVSTSRYHSSLPVAMNVEMSDRGAGIGYLRMVYLGWSSFLNKHRVLVSFNGHERASLDGHVTSAISGANNSATTRPRSTTTRRVTDQATTPTATTTTRRGSGIGETTPDITPTLGARFIEARIMGPLLYASASKLNPDGFVMSHNDPDIYVSYNMPYEDNSYEANAGQLCAKTSGIENIGMDRTDFRANTWQTGICSAYNKTRDGIFCRCSASGFMSGFTYMLPEGIATSSLVPAMTHPVYTTGTRAPPAPPEFFGFPYVRELYIAGHVLRAISLTCLLITIFSYLIFRKVRRGVATRILLHLCLSLVALLVLFYVAEAVAGSRMGCRVTSGLRLYLILVSLMWNAVEALNMYLMIVKVFDSHGSHFVLKAAIAAWSLPLIPVVIVISVTRQGFDGIYNESCEFRCQLQPYVLYFAWLLPMGLILCHNTVLFIVVVRTMSRRLKDFPAISASGDPDRGPCMRLVGAVSLMVLLGVPWGFSAFGAIEGTSHHPDLAYLEGVFHVLFVVCVNLQGVFIFIFHCVRNVDVRQNWHSTAVSVGRSARSGSRPSLSSGVLDFRSGSRPSLSSGVPDFRSGSRPSVSSGSFSVGGSAPSSPSPRPGAQPVFCDFPK